MQHVAHECQEVAMPAPAVDPDDVMLPRIPAPAPEWTPAPAPAREDAREDACETAVALLACDDADLREAREVRDALARHGIEVTLDRPWGPGFSIADVYAARAPWVTVVLLVGRTGIGPWFRRDIEGVLDRCAERGTSVVPVRLWSCPRTPRLPDDRTSWRPVVDLAVDSGAIMRLAAEVLGTWPG